MAKPLGLPANTFAEVDAQDKTIVLPHFTAEDAFDIGVKLRNRLRDVSPKAALIEISLANGQILFRAASRSGVVPDNDNWVRRKRNSVLRFGWSTWAGHCLFDANEARFKEKFSLGETAGDYAIHGGGFPVRVKGVEGVLGVVVVSGLAQKDDHQVIVETLQDFITQK